MDFTRLIFIANSTKYHDGFPLYLDQRCQAWSCTGHKNPDLLQSPQGGCSCLLFVITAPYTCLQLYRFTCMILYVYIQIYYIVSGVYMNGCIWYALMQCRCDIQPAARLSPMTQNQLLWTAKAHDLWLLSWSLDFWRFSGYVAV